MPLTSEHRHLHYLLQRLAVFLPVLLLIIFGGAAFYRWLDSTPTHTSSYADAVYNVVMIMTAIGGDKPETTAGKAFMCALALVSVGILVSVLAQIFRFVSSRSLRDIAQAVHDRKVKTMPGHTIICGSSHTLLELLRNMPTRESIWIIVRTEEEARRIEHFGIHAHVEDFTSEHALRNAGIENASCVIACGENDAENAFVCLSAKHLRKDIPVIVRLTRSENREKLKTAGADEIISPAELAAAEVRKAITALTPSP